MPLQAGAHWVILLDSALHGQSGNTCELSQRETKVLTIQI